MTIYEEFADPAFLDFLGSMFGAVPIGFLLALFLGLLAFGVFRLLELLRRLIGG